MLQEGQIKHKEIYKLGEVSHDRFDKPRGFFNYSYFNTAKMMFFMQRKSQDEDKYYPLEMYFVNNWLFLSTQRGNIFNSQKRVTTPTAGYGSASRRSSSTMHTQSSLHILEKDKRVITQV